LEFRVLQEHLQKTKFDLDEALSLPSYVYTSDEIFKLEMERIFYSNWLSICHTSQIQRPGDIFVQNIGTKSVLVVMGDDGKVRAFHNVCRHKGSRLISDSKKSGARVIQCPYHSWTYRLDGTLAGCPDIESWRDFDKRDYPLYPVKSEVWGGFVWVNFNSSSQPLREYLGDFADRFEKYHMEDLHHTATIGVYDVDSNWKILCENFNECYHCPTVHPETLKPYYKQLKPSDHAKIHGPYVLLEWKDYNMSIDDSAANAKEVENQLESTRILGLSEKDAMMQWQPLVFPNFSPSITADYVFAWWLWPLGPQKTKLIFELCTRRAPYLPDDYIGTMKWADFVMRQDFQICKVQQEGMNAEVFNGCAFSAMEEAVHSFQKLYANALEGIFFNHS